MHVSAALSGKPLGSGTHCGVLWGAVILTVKKKKKGGGQLDILNSIAFKCLANQIDAYDF